MKEWFAVIRIFSISYLKSSFRRRLNIHSKEIDKVVGRHQIDRRIDALINSFLHRLLEVLDAGTGRDEEIGFKNTLSDSWADENGTRSRELVQILLAFFRPFLRREQTRLDSSKSR